MCVLLKTICIFNVISTKISMTFFCCCSVTQSCPALCDPMDCRIPGFPVLHHLLGLAQTHVHWVWMPPNHLILCHPLLLHLQSFQHQGLFQWVYLFFSSCGQSIEASTSALALPMNIQDWFPLRLTELISMKSKGLSRVFSNTTVQKHKFFGVQPSLWSNSHIHAWPLDKP